MLYSLSAINTFAFAFTFTAGPQIRFTFDNVNSPLPTLSPSFKRRRPLWDVDGGVSEGKKKRRLRLDFITSRLSQPFSSPASNIANRGITMISIHGRSKSAEKTPLRKTAIMNRVRTALDTARAAARMAQEEEYGRYARAARHVVFQKPKMVVVASSKLHKKPRPFSPVGLSDYQALDLEDEMILYPDIYNADFGHGGSVTCAMEFLDLALSTILKT